MPSMLLAVAGFSLLVLARFPNPWKSYKLIPVLEVKIESQDFWDARFIKISNLQPLRKLPLAGEPTASVHFLCRANLEAEELSSHSAQMSESRKADHIALCKL